MVHRVFRRLFAEKPHVFMSYAREDREQALRLRTALAASGFDVWWDDAIHAGDHWSTEIQERLAEAHCVLVVWSKNGQLSPWVRHEASTGLALDTLVSVTLDEPPGSPFDAVQAEPVGEWSGELDARPFTRTLKALTEKTEATLHRRRVRWRPHWAYGTVIAGLLSAIWWLGNGYKGVSPATSANAGDSPASPTDEAVNDQSVVLDRESEEVESEEARHAGQALENIKERARRLTFCVARENIDICAQELEDLNRRLVGLDH